MSHASETLNSEIEKLKTLRDELLVKLHLAGMDAKDSYHELTTEAEATLRDVASVTRAAATDLANRLGNAINALGKDPSLP